MIDVTAIITVHREGAMAGISHRSLMDAIAHARSHGIVVEALAMMDDPDDFTRAMFADGEDLRVEEVCFKDQGKVRNHAVELASGQYVAFLDGDDLWSENWLTEGVKACRAGANGVIVHPEFNWFFESNRNIFIHTDQLDPAFDPAVLRFANYWDALCVAPRQVYLHHPFADRDVPGGFAYEDWHWNCETVASGFVHRVAPGTIHFKRRRLSSQTIHASSQKCLTPDHRLLNYEWYAAATPQV